MGWTISQGAVSLIDCEIIANKKLYRLFAVGIFDDEIRHHIEDFQLSVSFNRDTAKQDQTSWSAVFTQWADYYDYVYSFTIDQTLVSRQNKVEFCSKKGGGEEKCQVFPRLPTIGSDNFELAVQNLCLGTKPPPTEEERIAARREELKQKLINEGKLSEAEAHELFGENIPDFLVKSVVPGTSDPGFRKKR